MSGSKDDLQWSDTGSPRSRRFDDIYFDAANGAAESEAVFLDGCGLPDRWMDRNQFVIGETGFGTGLNLLVTWRRWRQCRRPGQRLHFLSIEGYPLTADDIRRAASPWPDLAPLANTLADRYPEPTPGLHRISLAEDGLWLTLAVGDVSELLPQLQARVDAWFLDGFAPARNPDMWRDELWPDLARMSASGATLGTFTAAGRVRRGLEAAGFSMHKTAGFGSKRERLVGHYAGARQDSDLPAWSIDSAADDPGRIAIIGAGLAGSWVARSLLERGIQATVIAPDEPCASDNPLANVMPRLPKDTGAAGRLNWSAFHHASRVWTSVAGWRGHGALSLARGSDDARRQLEIAELWGLPAACLTAVSDADASDIAGVGTHRPGLWIPAAGSVSGQGVRQIDVERIRQRAGSICPAPSGWTVDGRMFDQLVIATGPNSASLMPDFHLPLHGFAGQISWLKPSRSSAPLRATLTGDGYLTPTLDGRHVLGATMLAQPPLSEISQDPEHHQRNLDMVRSWLPELGPFEWESLDGGWAGMRVATPDRLPMAGPIPLRDAFIDQFAALRQPRHSDATPGRSPASGIHVLAGLGSRAFTHAPLAAELLIARLLGEPWPVEAELGLLMDPARFLVRDLKRSRI